MLKAKLLIIAEQSMVFKPYQLILKNFFESISTLRIDNFETFQTIQIDQFNIILIDLYSQKYIDSIKMIPHIESQEIKIVLISPFNLAHIPKSINNLVFLHLILTKPIEITKLRTFIENETKK
jgi:DNA-binding NtrC family response regulator